MTRKVAKGTNAPGRAVWLILVMVGSIALSVAGVLYAVWWGAADDGGRGGALGVALTFLMLFMGRGTPQAALEVDIPEVSVDAGGAPPASTEASRDLDRLRIEVARVRNAIASMLDWQGKEKVYLTVSSVVATVSRQRTSSSWASSLTRKPAAPRSTARCR